jgi:hypothetical protein
MRALHRYITISLLSWTFSMAMGPLAHAHLMVAQHGTLNIVDDAVFMVLSLPISAFNGVDEDSNGKISILEFNNHRDTIVESLRQNVTLSDRLGNCSLQGVMLSPVASHGVVEAQITQLTVMGRFTLNDPTSSLRFHIGLYGRQAAEQLLEITATRTRDHQQSAFELTPANNTGIFP